MKHGIHCNSSRQSGVVLITGLVFVVISTLIVLAVLRSGTLEERMAANARNRQLALQAAEAVLRDGEVALFGATGTTFDPSTSFTDTCTNGLCTAPASGSTPRWKTIDWSSTAVTRSFALDASTLTSTLVASQPRYFVEVQPFAPPILGCDNYRDFRLTARGLGQDASEVYVQSVVRVKYCVET